MANPEYSNKKEDFPKFIASDATIKRYVQGLERFLSQSHILQYLGIESAKGLSWDEDTLFQMLKRVEMRRIYFHVFHKGIEMGELNGGCLLCFWTLKLMPFQHETICTRKLNLKIALCLFSSMLRYVATKKNKTVDRNGELVGKLAYAFQYRDLSKEALMILAETFLQTK